MFGDIIQYLGDKFATEGFGKKVVGRFALLTGYIRKTSSWKVLVVSWGKRRIEIIFAVIRELTEQGKKGVVLVTWLKIFEPLTLRLESGKLELILRNRRMKVFSSLNTIEDFGACHSILAKFLRIL
tara:strand:- start:184 stop:561 length:378 start_codon:yes stop_codon:yes gene_type:complete